MEDFHSVKKEDFHSDEPTMTPTMIPTMRPTTERNTKPTPKPTIPPQIDQNPTLHPKIIIEGVAVVGLGTMAWIGYWKLNERIERLRGEHIQNQVNNQGGVEVVNV